MIHDLPKSLVRDSSSASSRTISYADDTTVYAKSKDHEHLIMELQLLANIMSDYCNKNGLVLNGQKTQILSTTRKKIEIKVGQDIVSNSNTISLLAHFSGRKCWTFEMSKLYHLVFCQM